MATLTAKPSSSARTTGWRAYALTRFHATLGIRISRHHHRSRRAPARAPWTLVSPRSGWADLRPGAVVDGVVVGGAGHGHVPLHRPGVGVLEALAGVGLRSGVEQPPRGQLAGLE